MHIVNRLMKRICLSVLRFSQVVSDRRRADGTRKEHKTNAKCDLRGPQLFRAHFSKRVCSATGHQLVFLAVRSMGRFDCRGAWTSVTWRTWSRPAVGSVCACCGKRCGSRGVSGGVVLSGAFGCFMMTPLGDLADQDGRGIFGKASIGDRASERWTTDSSGACHDPKLASGT